jgi:hypothetical protein
MARVDELLRVNFDGDPVSDVHDVIGAGLDDPRRSDRVPGLIELMNNPLAPEQDRFLACLALVTWAEPAGFEAVTEAAGHPKQAAGYDTVIDRMYSVDNTFAQLAEAIGTSGWLMEPECPSNERIEAIRSLVRIADTEYFNGHLEDLLDEKIINSVMEDIKATVHRGVRSLAEGVPHRFPVAAQLVDLAAAIAIVDESAAVELGMAVVNVDSSHRVLNHAVAIVHRTKSAEGRTFGEYLMTVGDEKIRQRVKEAFAR